MKSMYRIICAFYCVYGITGFQIQDSKEFTFHLMYPSKSEYQDLKRLKREETTETPEGEKDSPAGDSQPADGDEENTGTKVEAENATNDKETNDEDNQEEDSTLGPEETFEVLQDFFTKSSDYVVSTLLKSLKLGLSISKLSAAVQNKIHSMNSYYDDEESQRAVLDGMKKKVDEKLSMEDLKNDIKKKINILANKIH